MNVRALADAGALIAWLDRDDPWHEWCREAFEELRLPLSTSTAVLTELFHLVGDNKREVELAWKFVRSGAVTVLSISDRDLPDLDPRVEAEQAHRQTGSRQVQVAEHRREPESVHQPEEK